MDNKQTNNLYIKCAKCGYENYEKYFEYKTRVNRLNQRIENDLICPICKSYDLIYRKHK